MRVFVAYGYEPEELWVRRLVIPMLVNVGLEVIDGEEIFGAEINPALRRRIESADALIGFLLQRHKNPKNPDGTFRPSVYVEQEINVAVGLDKAVIQVVQDGVSPVSGMLQGTQHLNYSESAQADFLVTLLRHVRDLIEGEVYIRLGPQRLVSDIAAQGLSGAKPCTYDVLHQGHVIRRGTSRVFGMGGSLCIKLVGFREGHSANLEIEAKGVRWSRIGVDHSNPLISVELSRTP